MFAVMAAVTAFFLRGIDRALNGGGIIGSAITSGTEITDVEITCRTDGERQKSKQQKQKFSHSFTLCVNVCSAG